MFRHYQSEFFSNLFYKHFIISIVLLGIGWSVEKIATVNKSTTLARSGKKGIAFRRSKIGKINKMFS